MNLRDGRSFVFAMAGLAGAVAAAGVVACGATDAPAPVPLEWSALASPPADFRPWVRWWWPGNDVTDAELQREVGLLADNGFGGAEIQAFDAALDPKAAADELARRRSYDTDEYWRHVRVALDAAKGAGLTIDLTLGSGWPSGGPHVAVGDSNQTLAFAERKVDGPGPVTVSLAGPDQPPFYVLAQAMEGTGDRMARYLPDQARLIAIVAASIKTWGRDTDSALDLVDVVELDPATVKVLTERPDADGNLAWTAPAGSWDLIAFYAMPDGQYPSLPATTDPGFVVNHFDAARFTANLEHLMGARTGLAPYFGNPLRAFFDDSFEFKTDRHFTDDFLAEFQKRRGYDVVPWLPAVVVPGADDNIFDGAGIRTASPFLLSADDARVRYDYQLTVSDLFRERFLGTANTWAAAHGLKSRVQPYGIRIDGIRAAGEVDLPEVEQLFAGGADVFLQVYTSGAHLYGRDRISAESLVWGGRDYMTTPLKIKAAADKLFTAGVNHLIYHGFPYRKTEGYGLTGWDAFCSPFSGAGSFSSNLSEGDVFWPYLKDVNRYVSRVQWALRQGKPQADLLIYFPWLSVSAALARAEDGGLENLFNGALRSADGGALEPSIGESTLFNLVDGLLGGKTLDAGTTWLSNLRDPLYFLRSAGFTFDFVNDHSLAAATWDNGAIDVRGNRYKALLVVDSPTMQPDAAAALAALAEAGAPFVAVGVQPTAQPGFDKREAGDKAVADAMARARAGAHALALDGLTAKSAQVLVDAGIRPDLALVGSAGAAAIERVVEGGGRIFFVTRTPRMTVDGGCPSAVWYDAWHDIALTPAQGSDWPVPEDAADSGLLFCGFDGGPGNLVPEPPASAATATAIQDWSLDVTGEDVKGGAVHLASDGLGLWGVRAVELAASSSPGVYRGKIPNVSPRAVGSTVTLDLGRVFAGVVQVSVDGWDVGTLLALPWRVAFAVPATSRDFFDVVITLTPPLRNGLIFRGNAGDPEYAEFAGKDSTLLDTGIVGPVTVR